MRDQLTWAAVSALMGVVLGSCWSTLDHPSPLRWAGLTVAGLLVLLCVLASGPLRLVLRSPGKHHLRGIWRTEWEYMRHGKSVKSEDVLEIRQEGRWLDGRATNISVSGPHRSETVDYELSGSVLPNGVVEGKWRNIERSSEYRGHFQGHVVAEGLVSLRWIGLSQKEGVRGGEWHWHLRNGRR